MEVDYFVGVRVAFDEKNYQRSLVRDQLVRVKVSSHHSVDLDFEKGANVVAASHGDRCDVNNWEEVLDFT